MSKTDLLNCQVTYCLQKKNCSNVFADVFLGVIKNTAAELKGYTKI